jgi:hypothetical protein
VGLTLPDKLRRFAQIVSLLASFVSLLALCYLLLQPSLTPRQKFSALYNFPLYSVGFLWLFYRLQENKSFLPLMLLVDILVVLIAASRFFGPLVPASGHALFLSYSLLTASSKFYKITSAILLVLTIALKLSWGDHHSWVFGIIFGLFCGILYQRVSRSLSILKTGG